MSTIVDAPDALPLLGRAAVMQGQRTLQLIASLGAGTPVVPLSLAEVSPGWTSLERGALGFSSRCERTWRISSAGVAIQRFSGDGLPPVAPDAFNPSNLPVGASLSAEVPFKLAFHVARPTGDCVLLADIGATVELLCYGLSVSVVGPANTAEVTQNSRTDPGLVRQGLIVDARIGIDAVPIESPIGNTSYRFSEWIHVPQNASVSIPVPRSATRVKIYQSAAGASSGDWVRSIGDPAITTTALPVGVVSFANRTNLETHEPVGPETVLVTDIDAAAARTFAIAWTIEP